MFIPPQAVNVDIYNQIDETSYLSGISDKMAESQLRWSEYYSKIKPVIFSNTDFLLNRLKNLTLLPDDWDGFGAIPPYSESISNCIKFIKRLPDNVISQLEFDDFIPSNYGTVIINLTNSKKEKVSIEFGKTKLGFFTEFTDNYNFQINETLFNYNSLPPELISAITKLYKSYIF